MKKILILGAGNRILGDDGLGSIVAEKLAGIEYENVEVIDAGTSLYTYLWPLSMDDEIPDEIIIMDVAEGENAGSLHFISYTDLEKNFISTHLFPDRALFDDISKRNVHIWFLLCEVGKIEKKFSESLSENGEKCVKNMMDFIEQYIKNKGEKFLKK